MDPSAGEVDFFVKAAPPWRCPLLGIEDINTAKHSNTH